MRLSVLDSPQSFEALRPSWEALADIAPHASIFTTWTWQWLWWRHYGAGQPLRIVVAREGDEVVGLLPLYIQSVRWFPGTRTRVLRFVGTGGDTSPDYLGALIRPGWEERAAPALARFAVTEVGGWDIVQLTDMHADAPFRAAISAALGQAGMTAEEGVSARISYLDLPPTWEAYLATLGRDRRYTVRNTRRRFESQPGARFFVWDDRATLDRAVGRLIELHHRRWEQKDAAHAFSSERYVGFHRDVIHALWDQDRLRLYGLEAQGAVVAMYYFYRFGRAVQYFQGGFDPRFERLRPGLVLMGYAIEHAIGEGHREFDMLRGDYDYKRQWAKQSRQTYQVIAYRPTPRAIAFRWRHSVLGDVKRRLIGLIRTPVEVPAGAAVRNA